MDIKYTILIIALLNFIIGFFVLSKNKKNSVNISFAIASFDLSCWAISMFFYEKPFIFNSEIWIKIVYLFVIGLAVSWTYFFKIFLEIKDKIFPTLITILAFLFSIILISTDYWVKKVINGLEGPETILGPAYLFFGIYILITIFWVTYISVKKLSQFTGNQKMQLIYIYTGTILYAIFATIFDVVIPLTTGNSRFFWLSTYFSLFFVGTTAYAIIKYRFMDIRFLLGRSIIYFFSFLTIIGFAVLTGFWGNKYFVNNLYLINLIILIISILLFNPIFRFFEKIASKYFYYTFYSYQQVLTDLGKKMTKFLDLNLLSSVIVKTLMETMKLERTIILLRDIKNGNYTIQKNIGFKEENGISLVRDNFLTSWLEKTKKPIIYEELELIIKNTLSAKEKNKINNLQESMKKIEAALCLPLFIEEKISGMIVMGNKLSGEPYSTQDIELLNTLSNQASIALQNAKSYSEIQGFNKKLEDEVEKATKELKEAYEELQKLDKAKSEFVSIASHQLRTPLTAVKGYISMMLEKVYGNPPEKMKLPLKNIYASNERLLKLVNDLLNVSRIEAGRIEIKKESFSLEEVTSSIIKELKNLAENKNIYLKLAKPKKTLSNVFADKDKIRQAIANIIDNAIHYTDKGGITVEIKENKNKLQIAVKDTGEGMTKTEIISLFESFSRGKAGTKLWTEGAGLGLYVTKKFITLNEGKVWAESEGKNKGSTFYIELPIK